MLDGGPCIVVLVNAASALFPKLEYFIMLNSIVIQDLCNNSLLFGLCVCDVLL
jgi:hypothetical protein